MRAFGYILLSLKTRGFSRMDSSNGVLVITSRVIATCFALTSFAAALIVGIMAENPLLTILLRALFTMIVCYMIGLVIGSIAQNAVQKQIEEHKRNNPIPGKETDLAELSGPARMSESQGASAV